MSIAQRITSHTAAVFFSVLAAQMSAQSAVSSVPQLYTSFFGTWMGNDHYEKGGKWLDSKVTLKITPDKHGMRFDYDYLDQDKKGKEHHDRNTRFVTLIPSEERVILQWEGSSSETYHAKGLAVFSQTGLGTFVFAARWPDRKPDILKCMFTLKDNEFAYQWDQGDTATAFKLKAVWTFQKAPTQASPSP